MRAPACTIQTQAEAVCELFGGKKEDIKVIGIRQSNTLTEFNSNNTKILNFEETKATIAKLAYIQERMAEAQKEKNRKKICILGCKNLAELLYLECSYYNYVKKDFNVR